jgi:hypothetical protein
MTWRHRAVRFVGPHAVEHRVVVLAAMREGQQSGRRGRIGHRLLQVQRQVCQRVPVLRRVEAQHLVFHAQVLCDAFGKRRLVERRAVEGHRHGGQARPLRVPDRAQQRRVDAAAEERGRPRRSRQPDADRVLQAGVEPVDGSSVIGRCRFGVGRRARRGFGAVGRPVQQCSGFDCADLLEPGVRGRDVEEAQVLVQRAAGDLPRHTRQPQQRLQVAGVAHRV